MFTYRAATVIQAVNPNAYEAIRATPEGLSHQEHRYTNAWTPLPVGIAGPIKRGHTLQCRPLGGAWATCPGHKPAAGARPAWSSGRTIREYDPAPEPTERTFASPADELKWLMDTQPDCTASDENTVIDTRDSLIAHEAAKAGLRLTALFDEQPERSDDARDDEAAPTEPGYQKQVPYTTVDSLTQRRIEWEQRTFYSSGLRRMRAMHAQDGTAIVSIVGVGPLAPETRKALNLAYLRYHQQVFGRPAEAAAYTNLLAVCKRMRDAGQVPNLRSLTAAVADPLYYEMDEDPTRDSFTLTDAELHGPYVDFDGRYHTRSLDTSALRETHYADQHGKLRPGWTEDGRRAFLDTLLAARADYLGHTIALGTDLDTQMNDDDLGAEPISDLGWLQEEAIIVTRRDLGLTETAPEIRSLLSIA